MKKRKKWTTAKLITIGAISVIDFLSWLILGATLFFSTGNVFAAFYGVIGSTFLSILVALIVQEFGAVTLFRTFRFFIGLPLPTILPKLVNLFVSPFYGLTVDTLSLLLLKKGEKVFSIITGLIYNLILSLELIILYFTIGFVGIETVPKFLPTPVGIIGFIIIISLLGALSGYLAFIVYNKLKNTTVVKRIQK